MSTPFTIDVADFEFVLFEQLRVHEVLGSTDAFGSLDRDTYAATLREAAKFATEVLAPINAPADRQGCTLDESGNVRTPEGFPDVWRRMEEGGWISIDAPVEFGGVGMPHVMDAAMNDMFIGASTAFMMYPGLTASAARMIEAFGDGSYRELVATKLFAGAWAGTMCLTESGAGSSVGDNRARAVPSDEPGVYHLEGEKIFISGGDHDMVENIIHLVLARTPEAPAGTKGLSLFMVPKFEFSADGALVRRNGAKVVGLEHKMGIRASSTCTLALGAEQPCKGWLLGQEGQGMAQMFKMMNEARISVARQGAAAAGAAYNFALQYATERVQGSPLRAKDGSGSVPIVQHPDVRRMLMTLKVTAETTRAACIRIAFALDRLQTTSDPGEREALQGRADLLIPVLKAHCTDLGFEMAALAVQVYGGYGYIQDYPVEQLVRDTKIQSIYEGTNGIQAMDLLGRKLRIGNGALFQAWVEEARTQLQSAAAVGFTSESEAIGRALGKLVEAAQQLGRQMAQGAVEVAFGHAVPFLKAFGGVVLALEAVDQAICERSVVSRSGTDVRSKALNLKFYVAHLLPQSVAHAATVLTGDDSHLDPESLPTSSASA